MISRSNVDSVTLRKSFNETKNTVPVPNLIEVQSKSFNEFIQLDCMPSERKNIGLEKAFRDIFPIEHNERLSLEYVSYEIGNWSCTCGQLTGLVNRHTKDKKTGRYITCSSCHARVSIKVPFTPQECRDSEETYALPLKVRVQLITWDIDEQGTRSIHDIKEQDVYFADVPVMVGLYQDETGTYQLGDQGTFIINGVDRVVVSQLHRSPGAVFAKSKKTKDLRGRPYYVARIIPMRGSWIDFEFDTNDCLYARIDKKKKIFVTTFLQALGYGRDSLLSMFYQPDVLHVQDGIFFKTVDENLLGRRIERGMLAEKFDEKFVGKRITKELIAELLKANITQLNVKEAAILNKAVLKDVVDQETGEVILDQGTLVQQHQLDILKKYRNLTLELIDSAGYMFQPALALTLSHDIVKTQNEALHEIHVKVWPGDSASLEEIKERLERQFFSSRYYDLTKVGRVRLNAKLGLELEENVTHLTREDIIGTIKYLINLRERGEGELDDIDHLGNRRVRLVGELLANQIYGGLARVERIAKERFRMQEAHNALMPQDFLNVKPLSAVLREFFGSGQLSQFMDQTNPLSELAHKRRLSALGPGGVMKDRATNEVRDVHPSHYGRICPIETPEGQTIGLISSLSTYAMVNDLGFIESAYRPVKNGKILDDVVFLNAFDEASKYIAQADAVADNGTLDGDKVLARHDGNFMYVEASTIDFVDLSPQQLVSVAASLIPFLEHDDASRALMGANMQRQAVPLIKCQIPLVGTGMEAEVIKASGAVVISQYDGQVQFVSADRIVVLADKENFATVEDWVNNGVQTYELKKFNRSSYSTWIHQRPVVKAGDRVVKGDIISDGAAINESELALGTNLVVAFMPWHGYNFEDALVISNRLVAQDELTSVSIDEYSAEARDTKLGPEEITRDIPNVGEKALSSLDEYGIIKTGSRVKPGDILVGKVTLKGDVQYSPEEKLLRAIFGEKSREVRDTSLRVSPGVEGTVVDVKVFSRSGARKDKRYKEDAMKKIERLEQDYAKHIAGLQKITRESLAELLDGQTAATTAKKGLLTGSKFEKEKLLQADLETLFSLKAKTASVAQEMASIADMYDKKVKVLEGLKLEKEAHLKKGNELPSGVIKVVKVYIASRRHVSVGDKLAGRHGNKGVVSNIVRIEDMPFLDDGTPVDIVLNPLGVPSRMNVGQILETVLGFAGKKLGEQLQQVMQDQGYEYVKKFLQKFFDKQIINDYEKTHGQEGVIRLARRTAQTGLHFKTPIFQGPDFELDIKPLLKELGLSENGAYKVRDGRTGDYFEQPVTIGVIYIMKLNHMVDDKLHARSVGPYSLITQQPLGGKAQFGGQRFGEMEVWALEAYGAAYTLQEMLTYKSDDVTGRHRVYETIVRGDEIPDPGLPESFNVLVKELQSLGMQVDLFKTGREELGD